LLFIGDIITYDVLFKEFLGGNTRKKDPNTGLFGRVQGKIKEAG